MGVENGPAAQANGLPVSYKVKSEVKVVHLCPTLCDPMDYTVHGIFQAEVKRTLNVPLSNHSPGCLSQKNATLCSYNNKHVLLCL